MATALPFDLVVKLPQENWWETPTGYFPGWVWPLVIFENHQPVITPNDFDEEHPAVDIENDRSVVLGERRIRNRDRYPAEHRHGCRDDDASPDPSGRR